VSGCALPLKERDDFMEKRSLLAMALSAGVIFLYYTFFFKPPSPPPAVLPLPVASETESSPHAKEKELVAPEKKSVSVPENKTPRLPLQQTSIDTSLYQARLSSEGGILESFRVKGYRETTAKNSPFVDLFATSPDQNLSLEFREANFSLPEKMDFEVLQAGTHSVEYRWKSPEILLSKKINWDENNYSAHVKVSVENLSDKSLQGSLGLRLESRQHVHKGGGWGFLKAPENLKYPVLYPEKGIVRHPDVKELPQKTEEKGLFQWAGLEDQYFLWAIVSRALSSETRVEYGWREENILYSELFYPKEIFAPASKLEKEFTLYVGPKDIEHLKILGVHLEDSVDYGWFSVVAHPILFLLKFFHRWVGNWGVAIILLTVFIKLILHPVNKKTLESMKAMQKLQPKLVEIREKYKNDKERLNVEMMNLFKTHKVNPMGGCLPMLLQMPVYIALYKVLYNAIELYHAPFFWFYKDLSAPDPYFISPVLLGVFMVLQQKMTPSTYQDPAQAKMMLFMPIMFSAFMLFLPSGLVIYIFVNTLMTVIQQYTHQHDLSLADLLKKRFKPA